MEDNKTIKELNIESLINPETNKIDISSITLGKSKRNNDIVPDDIFENYYRQLPDKVENASGTWRTSNGGKIKIFGGDPEADKLIHKAGADASNAAQAQRRTFCEILDVLLGKTAEAEEIECSGLKGNASNKEVISATAVIQAKRGDDNARRWIEAQIGEKPKTEISAEVSYTEEDQAIVNRVAARLDKS